MNRTTHKLQRGYSQSASTVAYEKKRFESQLSFAWKLADMLPGKRTEWEPLLRAAEESVATALGRGDVRNLIESVRKAEQSMKPISVVAKTYTIYCVGHAHIDMNWQWSWPETVSVTVDSITTVLKLMAEFPFFTFSQSQASVYEILERYRPDLLEHVQRRVREGRWEVTASHWVEADKNLADGESLCRHLLYTRAYIQSLFALRPEDVPIDWSPDTFGHAHTVPTYLARGGVKYLYLHRPGAHGGQKRHQAFWWVGPDGSRILVRNDMYNAYNGVIGPDIVDKCLVSFWGETQLPFAMFVYGVGDHGGGPTRRDLARIADMDTWPVFPRITSSTAKLFYERLEQEGTGLPTIEGELNFEFSGCYTTQTLIKRANRLSQSTLVDTEVAGVFAGGTVGTPYPAGQLVEHWRKTLFSHFHDILPGSGVRDTRTYTHGLFQDISAFTASAQSRAMRDIASRVVTRSVESAPAVADLGYYLPRGMGGGAGKDAAEGRLSQYGMDLGTGNHPFVLFNTTETERREIALATVWDPESGWNDHVPICFTVRDADGNSCRAQVVEKGDYWGHRFRRIAFPVEVPALGYSTYVVSTSVVSTSVVSTSVVSTSVVTEIPDSDGVDQPSAETSNRQWARQTGLNHVCRYAVYERGPEGLENEFIRLMVDTQHGGILSLEDKATGITVAGGEGGQSLLEYAIERARSMSAWEIEQTGGIVLPEVRKIERGQTGPYTASLTVRMRMGMSDMGLTYELRAGDPRLYLHIRGTWVERGGPDVGTPTLRMTLPLRLDEPSAVYETPFGCIQRAMPHGEEVPAQRWAQVNGGSGGRPLSCVLFNDSKHGHSFWKGRLSLTLIRSSYEPDPLPEIGEHDIHCAIQMFSGHPGPDVVSREAATFTHELKVVSTDEHAGSLPMRGHFVKLQPGKSVLSALKRSEDGEGVIVRFYNPTGEKSETSFTMDPLFGEITGVTEVDLLERPVPESAACLHGGTVRLHVAPFSIQTARVTIERSASK